MSVLDADIEETVRSVDAEINYLLPGPDINRRFVSAGVEGNTGAYRPFPVKVRDGRTIRRHLKLDVHGFELFDSTSAVKDFYDKDEVDRIYEAEVSREVARLTGASFVATGGWMIRNSGDLSKFKRAEGPYTHSGGVQPPAGEAHIDTEPSRADRQAKAMYERVRPGGPGYKRFIYTSFWRTFSEPPQECPLAVCDHRTVGDDEGVPNVMYVVDKIPEGEAMFAPMPDDKQMAAAIFRHSPAHRWWYFSNMTRDEAILLKFHDSDHSVAWRTPHTAFWDPSFPDRQIRASIECRSVAFFE